MYRGCECLELHLISPILNGVVHKHRDSLRFTSVPISCSSEHRTLAYFTKEPEPRAKYGTTDHQVPIQFNTVYSLVHEKLLLPFAGS